MPLARDLKLMTGSENKPREAIFHVDDIDQYEKAKNRFAQIGDWVFQGRFESLSHLKDKSNVQKFSLENEFEGSISAAYIAKRICEYAAINDTRILRFCFDLDFVLGSILTEQNCKSDAVIWGIRRDLLVAQLRRLYQSEQTLPEDALCLNHAKQACFAMGRKSPGICGIVPLLVKGVDCKCDECLLIPSGQGSFGKNINAALSCDLSKVEHVDCKKNEANIEKLDMSECGIVKMIISRELITEKGEILYE